MIELFNGKTTFVWNIWNIIGLFFLIAGGIIEFWVRKLLVKKADFSDQLFTMLLKINFKHQLLKIGPFKYVRHPLYKGMLIQETGMGFTFSKYIWLIIHSNRIGVSNSAHSNRRNHAH